jgi:hypothetical protein
MRNALGAQANTSPIIWDSGASISISPDPEDFNGTLSPPGAITRLKWNARGLQIKGQGEVTWAIHDTEGSLRMIKVPAFYVPGGIKVRLLSTTSLLQTDQNEAIKVESHRLTLSGIEGDPSRGAIVALVNPQNNLPTSGAFNASDPFKAADALISTISEVHDANHNLSESEKRTFALALQVGTHWFQKDPVPSSNWCSKPNGIKSKAPSYSLQDFELSEMRRLPIRQAASPPDPRNNPLIRRP